jgi:ribosome-binding factor A
LSFGGSRVAPEARQQKVAGFARAVGTTSGVKSPHLRNGFAMARHRPKAPSQRLLRVGEELRHALARIFERESLRDPALAGTRLTVTEVRPSADLRHARVYVVPLGGGDPAPILDALKRVKPFLRRQMAAQVQMRFIPDLDFAADTSFDEAAHILTLLHRPEVARDLDPHAGRDGDDVGENDEHDEL